MSKQVISIKLQELDKSIGQIHDCIENFNKNDKEKIQENIKLLKKQCELDEKLMSKRIEKTKFKSLFISEQELELKRKLNERFIEIEKIETEEQLLIAEYALDFAVTYANKVLLFVLQAILKEKEELLEEEEIERS